MATVPASQAVETKAEQEKQSSLAWWSLVWMLILNMVPELRYQLRKPV